MVRIKVYLSLSSSAYMPRLTTTSAHTLSLTPLYLHLSPAASSFPPLLSVAPEYLISLNY